VEGSALFAIYSAFANAGQRQEMKQAFADGIAWGAAKQQCFELINSELSSARLIYEELISEPARIETRLLEGAERAREIAVPFIRQLRDAVGIRPLV
jgi:tryptophanyl-tRNA synthetase